MLWDFWAFTLKILTKIVTVNSITNHSKTCKLDLSLIWQIFQKHILGKADLGWGVIWLKVTFFVIFNTFFIA